MLLVGLRQFWGFEHVIFWDNEITILGAFTGAGLWALLLARLFRKLEIDLRTANPAVGPLLADLRDRLHHRTILVKVPLALAAIAIGSRYAAGADFNPFILWRIDLLFCAWLFVGFFLILNTTALCARYTEIARVLGHEVAEGRLGHPEMRILSRFYLKVAVIASFHFAACALTVYDLYLIYTYAGKMWLGYQLIRWKPGLSLAQQILAAWNDPLFSEVAIFIALYGSVSIAPVFYFILPQWEVHQILVRRKEGLVQKARQLLETAEAALGPQATPQDLAEYARCLAIVESVEKMPEWPFALGGKIGTILLVAIPSFVVFLKEVFLETLVQMLVNR
ncbi:MAG: hypothetical protein OZSIB_1520 [Candidatus Ozemobacter sibiricus]|uniref:Uncharacterized protein n=1 Tax=Candidatus Ozemobacter sibiricus TaxID=2268124 RepID=A0A367ZK33_9BACT|nr:MAG: hypothetical protein OZSIB_1520 [Candidatus Ozemobacter sibiricus]